MEKELCKQFEITSYCWALLFDYEIYNGSKLSM
jgi:hypothetical protein